jgi:hypothetical protein
MNAENMIQVFGLNFAGAAGALLAMGFENADAPIMRAHWLEGAPYCEQPCTLRYIKGCAVLVRDLELPGFTTIDHEKLNDFYVVEGRTLDGERRLYSVRFQPQETGPAVETWTEIKPDSVREPLATDHEGDERAVVFARTAYGSLFAIVTHPDNAVQYVETAYYILRAERYA